MTLASTKSKTKNATMQHLRPLADNFALLCQTYLSFNQCILKIPWFMSFFHLLLHKNLQETIAMLEH